MDDDDFGLGPAEFYQPYEQAEDMYFKLQLLNYEDEYLRISRLPALDRYYFMVATNSGEQYYNFVLLAAWLLRKCGKMMEYPQESDDPNTVISKILGIMREMDGVVDFSPSKVKAGCGPEVVQVLGFFAEKAVLASGVEFKKPVFTDSQDVEEEEDDLPEKEPAFQELDLDQVEEEMQQYYMAEDDDGDADDEADVAWLPNDGKRDKSGETPREKLKILESNTDAEEWRLELERVLPQLKITVKPDHHDWRWRYEQMENHTKNLAEALEQLEAPLEKVISEARSVTEKVQNRESYLSTQVQDLLTQLATNQGKIIETRAKHREQGIELANQNRILAKLTDDVEEARRQLDDRGTVMADGAPVTQVRKALIALKKEMGDMEVEIGVMEHCVLKTLIQEQASLRDKSNM